MICPACKGDTKIKKSFGHIRMRICLECKVRFITEEVIKPDQKVPYR